VFLADPLVTDKLLKADVRCLRFLPLVLIECKQIFLKNGVFPKVMFYLGCGAFDSKGSASRFMFQRACLLSVDQYCITGSLCEL